MLTGPKAAQERAGDAPPANQANGAAADEGQAAQDKRAWLGNALEFLPDATFVIDLDKRVVAWNRACETMTGVKKEVLLGHGDYAYAEAFYGERRPGLIDLVDTPLPEVEAHYKYVQRKGDAIYAESYVPRLRSGQGAHLWGAAAPLFDQEGRRRGAIEVIRDVTELKRVDQALRDSEERLRKVQRVAHVGFLDWDLRTNKIFLSDETCALTGFRPEGQVTTPDFVAQSVHPDDVAYAGQNLNLAIADSKPYDIVHRHLRPDGGIVWVHAQAEISRDENGAPARLLGTIVDITEQKGVEEALRESERKYRELVEHANSIILHWSRDGRVLFLNEFGQRFFGYSETEIVGRHVMGTIVPETETSGRDLRQLMDEICRNPAAFEQNVNENLRRNGEHVWVAWTNKVVLDQQGQVKEILSIGADITERKRAEARVLRLNHLYAALSRLNQTVVRATNRETLFRETCRIAVEHGPFRMAWIGLIDEQVALVMPVAFAGDEQGYLAKLSIAYQDEELGRGPTGTAIREGRCVLCQDIAADPLMVAWRQAALQCGFRASAAVPIRQGGRVIGALTGYAGESQLFDAEEEALLVEIGQVISYALDGLVREAQRQQAEATMHQLNLELEQRVRLRTVELNATNEQLRSKNSELKGFAYTVSHDLKAPLRGIAGYASELDRKHRAGLSERARFCLSQILTATSNLDHLIEDLLQYSRLDAETPSVTEVNLPDLVAGILRDRQLVITEQHIEVAVDIPFPTLQTWERGLLSVLANLIDNGIKYSRKATPPRLRIAAEMLDRSWRMTVNDNGIGFDMKYHDRIYGLFNRLVRMEEFEGTGAGLAIVKKVLDKVGGTVRAESSPGAGATFIVDIPKPPKAA